MGFIKITWTKSYIGRPRGQRRIVDSLGLKRLRHTVVQPDNPSIRGMIHKVRHMVEVEEIDDVDSSKS
jgi:large subunit ribosomal protein L30